ncbi:hypothetical protein ACVIRO_001029 [Rhizobium ruizarguesonis]
MQDRRELLRMYWSAAYLFRREPGRIRDRVIATITHVVTHSSGLLHQRAANLLREVSHGTGPNADPPAAG